MSRQGSPPTSARHRRGAARATTRRTHQSPFSAIDACALACDPVGRCGPHGGACRMGDLGPDGPGHTSSDTPRDRPPTRRGTFSSSAHSTCHLSRRPDRGDDRREGRRAPHLRSPTRSRGGDRITSYRGRQCRGVLARRPESGGAARVGGHHPHCPGRSAAQGPDVRGRNRRLDHLESGRHHLHSRGCALGHPAGGWRTARAHGARRRPPRGVA